MKNLYYTLLALHFASCIYAVPQIQGTCVAHNRGLKFLAAQLSSNAIIACLGSPMQEFNAGRYWGEQFGKNASVVVFPASTQDVSLAVRATRMTVLGQGFAFVGGAHGMTGAASSDSFIIDLKYLNGTQIINNYVVDGCETDVIAYQGGATWAQVNGATAGSGKLAVGARIGSVGVGGFSTGGGIGFLAGAYGFAIDRLRAMEVVLTTGEIVLATKLNQYSDLFWALQGGGGQFGIVTTFFQEAAPEPAYVTFGLHFVDPASDVQAIQNTVDFFNTHSDPFSLMYYAKAFFPANPLEPNPAPQDFGIRTAIVSVYFPDPIGTAQLSNSDTFQPLFDGIVDQWNLTLTVPYANLTSVLDSFFPYGFRRGFYGPQTTNVTTDYLNSASAEFTKYISDILATGDFPATALWGLQYMSPGLNGHLPLSDADTAWPHSIAGHQTLFSPASLSPVNDGTTIADNAVFDKITHDHQATVGPVLADYPNYISPTAMGTQVWGANLRRLMKVKQKYDPQCLIHNGRVFSSKGCVAQGFANV